MIMPSIAPATYTDIAGLASLRGAAQLDADSALEPVARQFESLFLHSMLKAMRAAVTRDTLFQSSAGETYEQMADQQLALDLSAQGGIGLAQVLMEQLRHSGLPAATVSEPAPMPAPKRVPVLSPAPLPATFTVKAAAQPSAAVPARPPARPWSPATPDDFITALWAPAQSAARALQIDPAVLIAQSALETGWGSKTLPAAGGSSLNLFNIKAGRGWQGPTTSASTLEYRAGIAARERALFRVYPSLGAAFGDYVQLVSTSPRYQEALARSADPSGYLHALQDAGYATDPAYAEKVLEILGQSSLREAIAKLKKTPTLPLAQ